MLFSQTVDSRLSTHLVHLFNTARATELFTEASSHLCHKVLIDMTTTFIDNDDNSSRSSRSILTINDNNGDDDNSLPVDAAATVLERQDQDLPTTAVTTVLISVAIALVSGTKYAFGLYSRELKDIMGISQLLVEKFGIWLDCGSFMSDPFVGWIYDRSGPSVSSAMAAVVVLLSYSTIQYIVNAAATAKTAHDDDETGLSVVASFLLKLAFGGVGMGCSLGYIGGLGSTAQLFMSFPKYSGRAVACVSTGYGLSTFLVGLSYRWLGGIEFFFSFWAVSIAIVYAGAFFVFRSKTPVTSHIISDNPQHDPEEEPLLQAPLLDDHGEGASISETSRDEIEEAPDGTIPWENWKTSKFWWLFLAFWCISGCGLFVINNLSTMAQSIGASDSFASTLVVVLSLSNAAGRIVLGIFGDIAGQNNNRNSVVQLQTNCGIMAVGLFLSAAWGENELILTTTVILAAFAYGGTYVVLVSILTDLFGKTHFGKDYGLLGLAPATSGLAFNTLCAKLYERQIPHSGGDNGHVCVGPECYRMAYLLTGFASLIGFLALRPISKSKQ